MWEKVYVRARENIYGRWWRARKMEEREGRTYGAFTWPGDEEEERERERV